MGVAGGRERTNGSRRSGGGGRGAIPNAARQEGPAAGGDCGFAYPLLVYCDRRESLCSLRSSPSPLA